MEATFKATAPLDSPTLDIDGLTIQDVHFTKPIEA